MFAVNPVFHWFTEYVTLQAIAGVGLGGGVVGAGVVGAGVVGAGVVGAGVVGAGVVGCGVDVESSPKKWIAAAASTGRLWPTFCRVIASTGARSPVAP